MTGPYVVAVDIGTQSTRAALIDREGRIADSEVSSIPLSTPRAGWAEQAPEDWWGSTVHNIAAVTARNPRAVVDAVGVGAQMHGVVPVASDGRALLNATGIWNDKRPADLVDVFGRRSDRAALAVLAANVAVPAWAGFKIAWIRQHQPEVYNAADVFVVVKDFLNLRLTGQRRTDPSEASGTYLMDAATEQWSEELLAAVGVDRAKLPPIVGSTEVIGAITGEAASATGLSQGTPVVCGGGDMLCQLLAAGATRPGRVCEVSGTASILAAHADEPGTDPRVMNLRAVSGGWLRYGIADAGGVSMRWFADRFCEPQAVEAAERGASAFAHLGDMAGDVPPGAHGLLFLPYLLGERTMGSSRSRGSIVGLTPGHGRAEILRAILEGVTLELRRTLDVVTPPGGQSDEPVRVVGGGASSAPWNRIRAAVYRRPVATLDAFEGGIIGAGLLAAVGAGWFPDAATASDAVTRISATVEPDPQDVAAYEQAYAAFTRVHDCLDEVWASWPS